jgi:hypothetical protein
MKTGEFDRKAPRISRLKSAIDVRRELGKLYRQLRTGSVDDREARTSVMILSACLVAIRDGDYDERLSALEDAVQ